MRKKMVVGLAMAMLAVALMSSAMSCAAGEAMQAAKSIAAYLPVVTALANDAAVVAEAIDADDASLIQQVNAKVQVELKELAQVSAAYVASPSTDNWMKLGAVVDQLVNDAYQGLLAAAGIKNAESQVRAKIALSALDAAVHVLDGYLAVARTPVQTQAAVAARKVKLQVVSVAWSVADWQRVNQREGGRGREAVALAQAQGY